MKTDFQANWVDGGASPMVRVRGLRTPQAAPVHLCLHCGTPLATEAARAEGFCCAGCSYVHRLVHEHGLEGYYRIRDAVVAPVDPAVLQPRDYAWLAELQAEAERLATGTPEMVLEVQGISCAGCVWLIEKVFHQQPGALVIETDAPLGRMRLRWQRGRFDAPAFARTLQSFNYLAGPPGAEPPVPESRALVRRIGLCAAFAMNIMLFALPHYFGMEATFSYASLFGTLAMGFATLSLLTGGSYFFGRAIAALRSGVLHIDLPIALGIAGAYAGSFYGWATGRELFVYFDFVGAFILLMLVGRWAQVAAVERNQRRLLRAQARPQRVAVAGPAGEWRDVPVENLQPGDVFRVKPGEAVPVEARLESAAATFGTAWITGEADPRDQRAGARVPAGSVVLSRGAVQLRAAQAWGESLLARLLRPVTRDAYRHRTLERIVAGYLIAILGVAVAAGVGWWLLSHDAERTWAVVTAVLVVSCPCAVGLAFPLAEEMATVALRRHGVFVREADLWPRLGRIRKLIFDKTGTLTLETPALANPGVLDQLTPPARAALLALVRESPHPVSQSLLENLLTRADFVKETAPAGRITEEAGGGVRLESASGTWTLGRPGWAGASAETCHTLGDKFPEAAHDTEFACDGVLLTRFRFVDAVRTGAAAEIAHLRARGLEVFILSGDRREKVAAMAQALGLAPGQAVAEATPAGKAAWVRRIDRGDTLMLGDGANDSLAFDAALARGTPVIHRGVLAGKADFYYLGRGLDGLRRLFEVNHARRRTQQALLAFSVAYNALAVGLAVTGQMNPLVAAILMPVSSLLSLAIVGAGMRRWLGR
ncbi:MAG TPA: heavy metal translocating P-type ATPase metal-binding domain-containing protein [Lacunisphaera sp.]|nr:heavy metal translocating P-type ATPase metal-binding domain-containing protein [Lacunisphaera sp.]